MLYVAPVVCGDSVGVLSCPSYAWGLLLVFYVAPVVCVCEFLLGLYVAPVVYGGSIGVLCCPSNAWGLLLVFMLPKLCV